MAGEAPDLRIALLGNSRSGKSATGNTILNFNRFRENNSPHADPRPCKTARAEVEGRNLLVIDTPGLFETSMDEEQLIVEMRKCARQSFPGLHAFLLVIRLDVGLSDEERNIVKWVQTCFGEEALRYTFILFTHADELYDSPLDEFIRGSTDLQRLVNSCGGDRYHAFNNRNRQNRGQVTELIQKIERMVRINRGHHNTLLEFEKSENSRYRWKMLKLAGIAIGGIAVLGGVGVGALALAKPVCIAGAKCGGVVLVKKAGLALLATAAAATAAAVGIGLFKKTHKRNHQRPHAH